MSGIVTLHPYEDQVSVIFNVEADEVMAIGRKMEAINEQAYMNGYNWDAFLNGYLARYDPDLLDGLEPDPEAGGYYAQYNLADADKAARLQEVIRTLISNPDTVYHFLRENGEEIDWD